MKTALALSLSLLFPMIAGNPIMAACEISKQDLVVVTVVSCNDLTKSTADYVQAFRSNESVPILVGN